jgi:hypothetical protein
MAHVSPARLIATLVISILLAGCGGSDEPGRSTKRREPREIHPGSVAVVPIAARDADVDLVVRALGQVLPHAKVEVVEGVPDHSWTDVDGTKHVDGRAVIRELERWYPAGTGTVMVVGVTSHDLQDRAVDTNYAFMVRDRPHAVLSTERLSNADPGRAEDRVAKLAARLAASVYLQPSEFGAARSGIELGPLGPINSLADLDALNPDLCSLVGDGLFDVPEGTDDSVQHTLGCPEPPPIPTVSGQTQIVADAYRECREDSASRCLDLRELIERSPEVGAAVDRATRTPGAICSRTCVFGLQLDAQGELVVRVWERAQPGVVVIGAYDTAMWTMRPDRTDDPFAETCVPAGGNGVCSRPEIVCPDDALLEWVQRRRTPPPASLRRPADC